MSRSEPLPHIKQIKDSGKFYLHWSANGPSGQKRQYRKSTGTADKDEALQVLAAFLTCSDQVAAASSVQSCLDYYKANHIMPNIQDKDRAIQIQDHLSKGFGQLSPDSINSKVVNAYVSSRTNGQFNGRKVTGSTVRRELNGLIAALNLAKKDRLIENLPFIPLPAGSPPRDKWLTIEDCAQWLDLCDPDGQHNRVYRFSKLKLSTGARSRPILNLQWKHVDLAAGIIDFRPTQETVSKKKRVAVPIASSLKIDLLRWKGMDEAGPEDHVTGASGPITSAFNYARSKVFAVSGNPQFESLIPYTFRHTWATLAARRGVAMEKIAGVLGDSISTVYKNYLHHSPDHLADAME